MAQLTNIRKFMIDGVEIPVYPEKVVASDNLVSRSWNNMYAEFVDIPVNLKYKFNWIFPVMSKKDLIAILTPIRHKIMIEGSRTFRVITSYPGLDNFIEADVYLGTPTNFESLDYWSDRGDVHYWKLELHWIETKGNLIIKRNIKKA